MKPKIISAIFARGGSKRVPRKNLRILNGKPLIAYAIEIAKKSQLIDRVVVSTDDLEIAEVAREFGAEVPFMRPLELADDEASEWMAWQHAIQILRAEGGPSAIDIFVCIPITSPLRIVEDVDQCINAYMESNSTDVVITVRSAENNPYYNMVIVNEEGYAQQVIQSEARSYRRTSYPTVYDMTTVAYVANPDFVMNSVSPFEGRVKAVHIPSERALDIDTELDFKFAEFLINNKLTEGRSQ
jgi:N,N'-diacetyl-8-epilegionaminate cytidylyltransferase